MRAGSTSGREGWDEAAFGQLMCVRLVGITGQPDNFALSQIEAGSVLMVTEHRRGRTGGSLRNTDERRDELVRPDGVPDLLPYIAAAVNPLKMFDGKVDLRRGGPKKRRKQAAAG